MGQVSECREQVLTSGCNNNNYVKAEQNTV